MDTPPVSLLFGLPADALSAYATVATAIIAGFALLGAVGQILVGKREARLAVAKSIYREYLELAFNHPEFSSASYPKDNPMMLTFQSEKDPEKRYLKFEQYEFFVSNLLFGAEEILDITGNDPQWRATLRDQLRYHALYLDGQDLPESHYDAALLTLRDEAIREYKSE